MWTSAGFLVSVGWSLYFASANKTLPIEPIVHALASLTQPIAAIASHHQLRLAWVVVLNAATYGLLGLIVEMVRHCRRTATQN